MNSSHYEGGAVFSKNSFIDLNNSLFQENKSLTANGGGAIYLTGGHFSSVQSIFSSNSASHQGGAIYLSDSNGSILRTVFSANQNTASNGAGAVYLNRSSPEISDCNFTSNSTSANIFEVVRFSQGFIALNY